MHSLGKAILLATLSSAAGGQSNPNASPTPVTVQAAVENLRHDPNLRSDKTIQSLHWVNGKEKPPVAPEDAPAWIVSLFRFLSDSASLLIWVVGTIGLAWAAVWLFRLVKSRQPAPNVVAAMGSSQVQSLDINPASLPADVGKAALELLEAGRTRDALSLLYRGALSRAVHRFAVAVGESFTEGEALRALAQKLDRPRVEYFAVLLSLWQRTVYAAEAPPAESVAVLCRNFAPTFEGTTTAAVAAA